MKVIFLDYDGVVNTIWFSSPDEKPNFNFPGDKRVNNTQAIGWLNLLYDEHEYSLVITSTWRKSEDYKECLYKAGLNPKIEILGRTDELNSIRGEEIEKWLNENKYKYHIEDYIIIDDDADMGNLTKDHLYQTNTYVGLSCNEIQEIMNRWDNKTYTNLKEYTKERKAIQKKEKQYKEYIEEHRNNIREAFAEMVMCPDMADIILEPAIYDALLARIETHDLSKYSEEEFDGYRKFFYPINKQEKIQCIDEFDEAWQHHKMNNDHHWENRKDNTEFTFENKVAVLENVCDWLAMGYRFNDRPYEYYERVKSEIQLNEEDRKFLEKVIYEGIDKECIARGRNLTKERWQKYGRV